jgi:hypothetical protein
MGVLQMAQQFSTMHRLRCQWDAQQPSNVQQQQKHVLLQRRLLIQMCVKWCCVLSLNSWCESVFPEWERLCTGYPPRSSLHTAAPFFL